MKKSIKTIFVIAFAVLIYILIWIGIPFDKEDLSLTYYCAMAIVKAILGGACIVAAAIIFKEDNHKKENS